MDDVDDRALRAFYKSLTNQGSLQWAMNSSLCLANEITCVEGKVTEIYLQDKGVEAMLPDSFANLTSLTTL